MWILEFAVVLIAIVLGARMGGIGIGLFGAMGVLALNVIFDITPGNMPIDVILIIMSVICAIAAMQEAGGLDYLVALAEKLLRKHPKYITFLAPTITYLMTIMAGTGHTAFSTLPVIAQVAKEQGIRPSRPLSIAVIASQIAITASPVSAAVVFMTQAMEPLGVGYLEILAICIPSTFIACMIVAFVCNFLGVELKDDPIYQQRLKDGLVDTSTVSERKIKPYAKRSVFIFLCTVFAVMTYATLISNKLGIIENPTLSRDHAIVIFMLSAAAIIVLACKINAEAITNATTFKQGMVASICVLGVAWLGDTLVSHNLEAIKVSAAQLLESFPWLLAVILFGASTLLYSQAATAKALIPAAIALGVAPNALIASFAAVSALFILPTYPTLLAACQMDDTGSTRIGRWVFNHPFIIPGTLTIIISVTLGFVFSAIIL